MNSKYKQSKEELQQHFEDTVQALTLSAYAFDKGFTGEAKRLAAAIRVLAHDTDNSKSLLGQLGRKNIQFYDTCIPRDPKTVITYTGNIAINQTSSGAKYIAPLDYLPPDCPPKYVSFEDWWNGDIFVDKEGNNTTRRDLILALANKDGGAHVDPELDAKYANLSRLNSLGWCYSSSKGDAPLKEPERAALRQIAHEVLKSLDPQIPPMKPDFKGAIFMNPTAVVSDKQPLVAKVGRNEPCPCGSGKKYKRCHGKS